MYPKGLSRIMSKFNRLREYEDTRGSDMMNTTGTDEMSLLQRQTMLQQLVQQATQRKLTQSYFDRVINILGSHTGLQCIRLQFRHKDGHSSFESCIGFSGEFWKEEMIAAADGETDPQTWFSGGNQVGWDGQPYYCADMRKWSGNTVDSPQHRFYNRCEKSGYLFGAVVPLTHRDEVLGVMYLADSRPHRIGRDSINFLRESVAPLIGHFLYTVTLELELARLSQLQHVGAMAASVGHEIRNPMTVVRGFLQVLNNKGDLSKSKRYFAVMIEELDRANAIIKEYLAFARGKTPAHVYTDMNTILSNLEPLIRASALENTIAIEMELGDIPTHKLDEDEIRQLVLNLTRNAVEAMPEGGRLVFRTYRDKDNIFLAIQDSGPGIAPHILQQLGRPFVTTKPSGTGLGLSVCYEIAERQNAKIHVDSNPAGTTFVIAFPYGSQKQA